MALIGFVLSTARREALGQTGSFRKFSEAAWATQCSTLRLRNNEIWIVKPPPPHAPSATIIGALRTEVGCIPNRPRVSLRPLQGASHAKIHRRRVSTGACAVFCDFAS